jgi:hypothetical protein
MYEVYGNFVFLFFDVARIRLALNRTRICSPDPISQYVARSSRADREIRGLAGCCLQANLLRMQTRHSRLNPSTRIYRPLHAAWLRLALGFSFHPTPEIEHTAYPAPFLSS